MRSARNGPLGYVRHLLILCATAALAVPLTANAALPQRVRNVNDAIIPESSFPRELGMLNGKLLFAAGDPTSRALWSTDGTAAGTILLKRFPGPGGMFESWTRLNFVVLGARAFIIADDGVVGGELWSTDGTPAGTTLVTDIRPGPIGGMIELKGVLGGRLVFAAHDANGFAQMFITDGTAPGTIVLTALGPSAGAGEPSFFTDDRFYFPARDDTFTPQLWVSDGTPGGTHALSNPTANPFEFDSPRFFTRVGNRVLYSDQNQLWRIDLATHAIDELTFDHPQGPREIGTLAQPISFGAFAMFITDGPTLGSLELWRTDGTSAGTFRLGIIHPGPAPFEMRQAPVFVKVGDTVVYIADDGVNGPQLWGSDGSIANTVRLTNVAKPPNVSHQIAVSVGTVNGIGYFTLPDGVDTMNWSVWRTDGTIAGTRRIAGLPAVDQSVAALPLFIGDSSNVFIRLFDEPDSTLWKYEPALERLTLLRQKFRTFLGDLFLNDGERLFFTDHDFTTGAEPWFSDGTAAGTHLVLDIFPQGTADNGSAPNEFVEFGGQLVFVASHGATGRELWISDGTEAGTKLVADINPGIEGSHPNRLVVANGALYFFATDATFTWHFMKLASPTAQPESLAVLFPPSFTTQFCQRDAPVAFGGNVYFSATAESGAPTLWKSDGTAAGTIRVTPSGTDPIFPCELTVYGNRLYFGALGSDGRQIWTSDGTSAGTTQVSDLQSGSAQGGTAAGLIVFNGLLYFTAEDQSFRTELWRTNGTPAGTSRIFAFNSESGLRALSRGVVNNRLMIELFNPHAPVGFAVQRQLWVSDGTAAGTALVRNVVTDGAPDLTVLNNRGYLAARDSNGLEPWVSDGTPAGTQALNNFNAGDSNPAWFADFRSVTLFTATGPNGPQLWRTDGTPAGNLLLADIAGAPTAFNDEPPVLRQQLAVGQKFFFVATDPEIGDELYVLVNESPVASADTGNSVNSAAVSISVLVNDTDADGTLVPQSVRVATNPAHGSVAINTAGSLVYTPAAGFSGTDTFTYTVDDNQGARSNAATVTVSVTAATVVTTGRKGGGGSMGAAVLGALCVLLGITRCASAIRSGASRTSAGRAMPRARRTTSTHSPHI